MIGIASHMSGKNALADRLGLIRQHGLLLDTVKF
jgi:hypothetical protein